MPVEETRPKVVDEMIEKLHRSGMPIDTTLFLGGHSLGGVTSQNLAEKYKNKVSGQILIGSFLQREYRSTDTVHPVPTLTLSGDLMV